MRHGLINLLLAAAFLGLAAATAAAETPVERGRYLVTTIGACGSCHTPRDGAGRPIAGRELGGGFEFGDPTLGHIVATNITPDNETGIGKWSAADIVTALRDGKRPDATLIRPPMPIPAYRHLSDTDAGAIASYLKTVKPVRNIVREAQYKVPLSPSYGAPIAHVPEPDRRSKAVYGGYLGGSIGACVLCHTPPGDGKPYDMSLAYFGGRELADFGHPGGNTVSRNITAGSQHGVSDWTDAQIKRAITQGIRADGARLSPTMPFQWYRRMAAGDLDAIVAFLRTLNPL